MVGWKYDFGVGVQRFCAFNMIEGMGFCAIFGGFVCCVTYGGDGGVLISGVSF